jgi:predicted GNAT family acetyltransferase
MPERIEYPDQAGYPDGMGFLDEGTAVATAPAPVGELDVPSADSEDDLEIVSAPDYYRVLLGGRVLAVMRVRRDGRNAVTIASTVVDAEARGRGIATDLIAHVLDELREAEASIVVECPEVAGFIGRHPEYSGLVVH